MPVIKRKHFEGKLSLFYKVYGGMRTTIEVLLHPVLPTTDRCLPNAFQPLNGDSFYSPGKGHRNFSAASSN